MSRIKFKLIALVGLLALCAGILYVSISSVFPPNQKNASPPTDETRRAIETALYYRTEFFGAEAIVPFPTELAEENLQKAAEQFPDSPEIRLKLSHLNERLGKFDRAEEYLEKHVELSNDKIYAREELASFYERRGQFEKQAEQLEKILELSPGEQRTERFSELIGVAKKHRLEKYLEPAFYQKVIDQAPEVFSILEKFLDKLIEEKEFDQALNFIRLSKEKFPDNKTFFIEKEVSLLLTQNRKKEAEEVYENSFEPLWNEGLTEQFYSFLDQNDRYRAYGSELKKKFRENPADFDSAVRLIHFERYDGDPIKPIILKMEKARADRGVEWTADELLDISLYLIKDGNGDLASRFLYTLSLKKEAQTGGRLRPKILYQLFELLSDAEDERIALTRGDLDFYRDIASADTRPGITTGIISLIFANQDPSSALESKSNTAIRLFNRAAAYRIFSEFKKEYPQTPQLAQMYLDLVRLHTAQKDLKKAQEILTEFAEKFADSEKFPETALKLADAFRAADNYQREREVYQKILDHFGSQRTGQNPLILVFQIRADNADRFSDQPIPDIFDTNPGISIPGSKKSKSNDYYYNYKKNYPDFISEAPRPVYYELVLNRFVASLARENKKDEILAFYNREIAKYPDEQGLYEHFLNWLRQTNFTDEQLRVYKNALQRFQNKTWSDKLARWYIRNEQKEEFEKFSSELIEKFNDRETREYLSEFIDPKVSSSPESFEGRLYLGLYRLAHQRFPHNQIFVEGLLKYYKAQKLFDERRKLLTEYYFEMPEIRQTFLTELSRDSQLRERLNETDRKLQSADPAAAVPYKLFRADASVHLSNFEGAVEAYRELNSLYPNDPEISESLISLTRSFGQTDRKMLEEAARISVQKADYLPFATDLRTRAGEIRAELGDYKGASEQWEKLIPTAKGEPETYLETATVYWDYFQYEKAQRTISDLRREMNNEKLYAFQAGAIYESLDQTEKAIGEYVKQLGAVEDDDSELHHEIYQAKKRLSQLSRRGDLGKKIATAFQKADKNPTLILNYVHYLVQSEQKEEALKILRSEIPRNDSEDFLIEAKNHFVNLENRDGERLTFARLAETADTPKKSISYRLQLADSYGAGEDDGKPVRILWDLVNKYPTNYGVLDEADAFFWRLGKRQNSLLVLKRAIERARGKYRYIFQRKLAGRLTTLDRLAEAENILLDLHRDDPQDTDVFDELTNIYVHQNKPQSLRKIAETTLAELKKQDLETREVNYQTIDLRFRLIDAFTRLKDYDSGVDQYIEIINLQPDDEEYLENAIDFVTRYGGSAKLLDYYQKLAADAYKNYRWYLVLARISEAAGKLNEAAENYRIAIHNQPENTELWQAISVVYEKSGDFASSIEAVDKVIELAGENKEIIQRKVALLEKAGRAAEAQQERTKLPEEKKPAEEKKAGEIFAEASRNREEKTEESIENYRAAFEKLLADPTQNGFQSSDISGYVETVRREEPLDEILQKLWKLREKLIQEAENSEPEKAGKARSLLSTLDGVIPDSVGSAARQFATGNELEAVFSEIQSRIEPARRESDKYLTLSLLHNLIERCDFVRLKEKILIARKDESFSAGNVENYHNSLNNLLEFYRQNGDFRRMVEVLEAESARDNLGKRFDYERKIADTAKILGDREKEFKALKNYFQNSANDTSAQTDLIERYFETLISGGENGRDQLAELARNNNVHQLQQINFLIARGERDLVHTAIESSGFSQIWKSSRQAEISLALKEFGPEQEIYFQNALQFAPIGRLIGAGEAPKLNGDDRFRLTNEYGKWLLSSGEEKQTASAPEFLPAMVENRPNDFNEQLNLGNFYLREKKFAPALEHLRIAGEMNPNFNQIKARLGDAYFQMGETEKAGQIWDQILKGDDSPLGDCRLYLTTLGDHGQTEKARKTLEPILLRIMKKGETSEADLEVFLRELAETFPGEDARAAYLVKLADLAPENLLIPKLAVEKGLVEKSRLGPFYQRLIGASRGLDGWNSDSDFKAILEKSFSNDEAEAVLDRQKNFGIEEPVGEKLSWQQKYLEFLLDQKQFSTATELVKEIENSLKDKYARPVWLRLARFRIETSGGVSDETYAEFLKFTGIGDVPGSGRITPPDLPRLNQILEILAERQNKATSENLRRDFYARAIALQQYDQPNFKGLADSLFEKGDREAGSAILRLSVEISLEETRPAALAELDSIPLIKTAVPAENEISMPTGEFSLNPSEAFQIAAETSTRFALFEEALDYRQRLSMLNPFDKNNLIELARLLVKGDRFDEAATHLSNVISDRNSSRNERWQAVFIAGELFGGRADLWELLMNYLSGVETRDIEMWRALEAVRLSKAGDYEGAVRVLDNEKADYSAPQTDFLKGIIARNFGRDDFALNAFIAVQESGSENASGFEFTENRPVFQIIRLYLKNGQPEAALKLAELAVVSQTNRNFAFDPGQNDSDFSILPVRTSINRRNSYLELLELLSRAAEEKGYWQKALDFEGYKRELLFDQTGLNNLARRIEELNGKIKEHQDEPKIAFRVDEKVVSAD
ncbi:MAG: hypothetical protein R2747_02805 [Pyrinomonadaceae bacterium]